MLDDLLIYAADLRSIAVTPERGTLGRNPTFLSLSKQALCWLRAKTGQCGPTANTPYAPMASQGLVTGWIKLSWISLAHANSGQYPGAHVPCGARRAGWGLTGHKVEPCVTLLVFAFTSQTSFNISRACHLVPCMNFGGPWCFQKMCLGWVGRRYGIKVEECSSWHFCLANRETSRCECFAWMLCAAVLHAGHLWSFQTSCRLPDENRTRYMMNITKQQKGSQAACPVTHFSNVWKH